MEAQLESLKRNSGSELIKAGDKRLQPKADATLKTSHLPVRDRRAYNIALEPADGSAILT